MARQRKRQSKISLLRTDQEIRAERKKLPIFKARNLRSSIAEANANQSVGGDFAILTAFRRRNTIQMEDLLRRLGVDPSQPDAWLRGFLLLAHYHHGVANLGWYPRRTNRNAATWTPAHDFAILREVEMLRKLQGLRTANSGWQGNCQP